MVERGTGHLVFIASLAGKSASPRASIYNATKFGLRGFALALRADLCRRASAYRWSALGSSAAPGMFADAGAKPPLGLGTGSPEEVGAAVVKAIERDRAEVTWAPSASARWPTSAWPAPGFVVPRPERLDGTEGGRRRSPPGIRTTSARTT